MFLFHGFIGDGNGKLRKTSNAKLSFIRKIGDDGDGDGDGDGS